MVENAKTSTLLDTSSDEGDDQPVPMTGGFVTQVQSMAGAGPLASSGLQQPTGIPRTQALPKGRTHEHDLLADLQQLGGDRDVPLASHQLPKGQLKAHQKNAQKRDAPKKGARDTLDLLKAFAESAAEKERLERDQVEDSLRKERIRLEKEKLMAKRAQLKLSKIGGGVRPSGGSVSPMRAKPQVEEEQKSPAFVPVASKSPLNKTRATGDTSPNGVSQPGVSPNEAGRRPSRIGAGAISIPGASPRNLGGKDSAPSMSPNNFKSKIGSGARDQVSPLNKASQQKQNVPTSRNTGHFGLGLSPVKDEDVKNEQDQQSDAITESTVQAKEVNTEDKAVTKGAFDFGFVDNEGQTELGNLKNSQNLQLSDSKEEQKDGSSSGNEDLFQNILNTDHTKDNQEVEEQKENSHSVAQNDETEEDSSLLPLQSVSQNKVTVVYQDEVEQADVDFLCLVKSIKRRPRADLIAEIQRELDAIDASIRDGTDEDITREIQVIENRMSMRQYRPEILDEFDLQIKKLDPNENISVPAIELDQFGDAFTKGYRRISCAFTIDDGQADKLRQELAKLQNDNERIDEEGSDDSGDLLGSLDADEVALKDDGLESLIHQGELIEEDSPSFMLPVPPTSHERTQEEASSILSPAISLSVIDEEQDSSLTAIPIISTEDIANGGDRLMHGRSLELLAQQHQGELDTLTEHPDQEDLQSQIDAIETRSSRGSIMVSKRVSAQGDGDLLAQIGEREKRDNRKGRAATMFDRQFASATVKPKEARATLQSRESGLGSLAKQELARPRSQSPRGEADLFDTDSEAFSAFSASESSVNPGSRESSPVRNPKGQYLMAPEKDIDNLEVSLIAMSANNRDFQRLVQEAKAEKEKTDRPQVPLSIETESTQVEEKQKEEELGLDLPKPLPKPQNKKEEDQQRKELRELVTYRNKQDIKDEEFKDTAPEAANLLKSNTLEPTISTSSLLSLLITDSSLKKARTTHLYLCEDRELTKSKIGLKILYEQLIKQNDVVQAAAVLLKISKVFFCLNQLTSATETVSKAVSDFTAGGGQAPMEALFWKGMIYFYQIFAKRAQQGQRKLNPQRQQAANRDLTQMITSCETALMKVTFDRDHKTLAKFLLLKLSLLVQREKFGCDLIYFTQTQDSKMVQSIGHDDYYYGQIAQVEVHIEGQEKSVSKAFQVLKALNDQFPGRGEAYIKLWQLNMYCGNQLKRSQSQQQLQDQREHQMSSQILDSGSNAHNSGQYSRNSSQVTDGFELMSFVDDTETIVNQSHASSEEAISGDEKAKRYYLEAYETVSQLLLNCDQEFTSSPQQKLLLVYLSVKSLQKSGQYIQAFELLQKEFAENPSITSLMYLYGKYVVKAMASEVHEQLANYIMAMHGQQVQDEKLAKKQKKKNKDFRIDQGYLGSGIGSLEECLRVCFNERHAKVNYYIGFAYKVLRMPLKTQEYWVKAFSLNNKQKTLSIQQAQQVNMFLKEQSFFTIIAENSDQMIKEKQGLKKPIKGAPKLTERQRNDQIKEYMFSMKKMGKIDQPNSLLFQARMEAYLLENETSENFGKAFDTLIEEYPTFIDGYINYWHYLKYRLSTLTKKAGKTKHAKQIEDASGEKLLDKMRECATQALMQSDATEVPTGLWVEARIVYAKQMVFEKEIGQAIAILKDICYIIPPYPIDGLSYVQFLQTDRETELMDTLTPTDILNDDMSADEMFMRQADMMKARNSPTRQRINKDAPLFQKKTFNQSIFGNNQAPRSQQVLPKGKLDIIKLVSMNDSDSSTQPKTQKYQKGKLEFNQAEDFTTNSNQMLDTNQMQQPIEDFNQSLDIIHEEEIKSSTQFSSQQEPKNHIGEAFQMLDQINELASRPKPNRNYSIKIGSSSNINNRISMYRKQPQALINRKTTLSSAASGKDKKSHKRTPTIYNPFNFNTKAMDQSVMVNKADSNILDVPLIRNKTGKSSVSQSLDFSHPAARAILAGGPAEKGPAPDQQLELAYQAMLKAQTAWQERQEMDSISEKDVSMIDEESFISESRHEAIIESENFAIYSNFKFLQLIGKYCAKSRQYSDEGLKALNDYLLLLDYNRGNYTKTEYYNERAITIFYIGSIFYQMKDFFHAVEHLLPIQQQLHSGKFYKELAESEHKVSKIWRLNFNEQTIMWDYFSVKNMSNFRQLESARQANRTLQRMKEAGNKKSKSNKITHLQ